MNRTLLHFSIACLMGGVSFFASGNVWADPVGDSYSLGITAFGENGGGYLNEQNSFTTLQFQGDGSLQIIGDSLFGEQGGFGELLDEFVARDTLNVLSATDREVIVEVFARNKSTLALTNWIADGATTDGGSDPFTESAIEIGDFNGGTDRIEPTSFKNLISSSFQVIGTDGNTYGSFNIDQPEVGGQLGGAAGLFLGADLATFEIAAGVEIAGYQASYVYAVPEPGGAGVVWLAVAFIVLSRKKRSNSR